MSWRGDRAAARRRARARATLRFVIRDRAAYERLRVAEEHRALRELDMKSSIAKLEALLTSSLLNRVDRRRPRPLNLIRALGIDPRRVTRRRVRTRP